jgi:hypothetical protein
MDDYIIVGLETDSEDSFKSYKRQVKYIKDKLLNRCSLDFSSKIDDFITINKVYLLDLKAFSIIKIDIEEYVGISNSLRDTSLFKRNELGSYSLTIEGCQLPFVYNGEVVKSDSLTEKLGYESLKYFDYLVCLDCELGKNDYLDCIDIWVSILDNRIALTRRSYVIQNMTGEIDNDTLVNNRGTHTINCSSLNLSDYIDLVDCGSHYEIHNTAIIGNDFHYDTIILKNSLETLLLYFFVLTSGDYGKNTNIVIPPSIKKIYISYKSVKTFINTTFLINKDKLKDIEFWFLEYRDFVYTHDIIKTDNVTVLSYKLEDKGIGLETYG